MALQWPVRRISPKLAIKPALRFDGSKARIDVAGAPIEEIFA
jgi:hypothetical protein